MDCLEGMQQMDDNSIDLVITDPPYGITKEKWDRIPDWDVIGLELKRIGKDTCQYFIFGMQPTFSQMIIKLQKYLNYKDEIIWMYLDGGAGNTKGTGLKNVHQNIAWFSYKDDDFKFNIDMLRIPYQPNDRNKYPVKRGKKIWRPNPKGAYPTNIFACPKHKELINGKTQFHNHYTIKPSKLIEKIILGFSRDNDLILDLYLGTGTTVIACKKTGRQFIGFELDEQFFNQSVKRISECNKQSLFIQMNNPLNTIIKSDEQTGVEGND